MSHLHDLMVLNNRLLRILQHSKPKTNPSELYLLYGTLPVNKLFKFQMLIHAHNIFYCSEKWPFLFLQIDLLIVMSIPTKHVLVMTFTALHPTLARVQEFLSIFALNSGMIYLSSSKIYLVSSLSESK